MNSLDKQKRRLKMERLTKFDYEYVTKRIAELTHQHEDKGE